MLQSQYCCESIIDPSVAFITVSSCFLSNLFSLFPESKSNQIKSLLLSHHHSTCALMSKILESVLHTVQKQLTYRQNHYLQTYADDNVQYTHTYTQYTQCTIRHILTVINTHYTPYVHILHYVHIYTHTVICKGAVDYT